MGGILLLITIPSRRSKNIPSRFMQWNEDFTSIPLKHMFVSSPLDDLINQLGGPGKVAEMTGRRGRVVKTDKQPQPHYEARESDSSNVDSLNIQEVSKMIRTKSCAVFRINLITVVSIDVILGQHPGRQPSRKLSSQDSSHRFCRPDWLPLGLRGWTLPFSLTFKNRTVVSARERQPSACVC